MDESLLWSGILTALMAAAHLHLALHLGARPVAPEARAAWGAFRAWWLGTGVVFATGGAVLLVAAAGALSVEILLTQAILAGLAMSVATGGLVYYVVFLYTGRGTALVPLAVAFAVHYASSVGILLVGRPSGFDTAPWAVPVLDGTAGHAAAPLVSAGLLATAAVAALLAYLLLRRIVSAPLQRYRILLVGTGTLLWLVPSILAYVAEEVAWLQLASRVLGVVGSALALAAYHPPRGLVARLEQPGSEEGMQVAAPLWRRA
jgi:hypothetical protein